jgi:hypothetical protein
MDNTALMQQLPFAEVVQCVKDMFPKKKREILKINFETLKPKNEVVTKVASDMLSKKKSFILESGLDERIRNGQSVGHKTNVDIRCHLDVMRDTNLMNALMQGDHIIAKNHIFWCKVVDLNINYVVDEVGKRKYVSKNLAEKTFHDSSKILRVFQRQRKTNENKNLKMHVKEKLIQCSLF